MPKSGIPASVRKIFVKVICICYCGNGKGYREGVDESALPYYEKYIDMFKTEEIKEYCRLFGDHEFTSDLLTMKVDRRMRKLAQLLRLKIKDIHLDKLLGLVINFPNGKLEKIVSDQRFKDAIRFA